MDLSGSGIDVKFKEKIQRKEPKMAVLAMYI
jgi:hypothetical protein